MKDRIINEMTDKDLAEEACFIVTQRFANREESAIDAILNEMTKRFCEAKRIKPYSSEGENKMEAELLETLKRLASSFEVCIESPPTTAEVWREVTAGNLKFAREAIARAKELIDQVQEETTESLREFEETPFPNGNMRVEVNINPE